MHSAEKKALEKIDESMYNEVREAAEVHRQVRKFAQSIIKPGISLLDIAQ